MTRTPTTTPRPRRYRWLDGIVTWNSHAVANGAKPLPDSAIIVAMYLGQYPMRLDGSGIRVSQATVAQAIGKPLPTVKDAFAALRDAGVLLRVKGHNRTAATEYQAVMVPVMYGYGADELMADEDPVGMVHHPYEPVDKKPVGMVGHPYGPVDNDLVGMDRNLVGMDSQSRRDGSPSREQVNRENRARTRPSGPVDTDAPAQWTNTRADRQVPIAQAHPIPRRYDVEDPTRPDGAYDYDVHDECGWTYGHLRHLRECVEARSA